MDMHCTMRPIVVPPRLFRPSFQFSSFCLPRWALLCPPSHHFGSGPSSLGRLALCWVVLCRLDAAFCSTLPSINNSHVFFDVGDATPPPGTLHSHSPFNTTLQHHAPTLAHNPSHHSLTCTDPRATPTQPVANVGAGLKKEQVSIYRVTSVGPKSPGMDATCKHSTAVDAQLSLTAWLTGRKMHCTAVMSCPCSSPAGQHTTRRYAPANVCLSLAWVLISASSDPLVGFWPDQARNSITG